MVGSASDGIRRDNKLPRKWMGMSEKECNSKLEKSDCKNDIFREWFMAHEFGNLKRRSETKSREGTWERFFTLRLVRVVESIPCQQVEKPSEENPTPMIRRAFQLVHELETWRRELKRNRIGRLTSGCAFKIVMRLER